MQPQGVTNGTRVVPLRYPMSIHWSGSETLAIGTDVAAAKAAGKVAILDPVTRKLTGLHTGDVTVKVTNDSMREYTDDASLAPVTRGEDDPRAGHARRRRTRRSAAQVPATLSLTLGAPATFGAFTPGRREDYNASTTANVTSTAGDAALDRRRADAGQRRVRLAQPVVVTRPAKTWTAPVANDAFAIAFKQSIAATDPLRTGNYSAAVTFTLSTTTP